MPLFPSEDWLNVYVERINASPEYREAAATWEGDVCYVFEPEPDYPERWSVVRWIEGTHPEVVDPDTFEPCAARAGALLIAAARFGGTRLIDNIVLEAP